MKDYYNHNLNVNLCNTFRTSHDYILKIEIDARHTACVRMCDRTGTRAHFYSLCRFLVNKFAMRSRQTVFIAIVSHVSESTESNESTEFNLFMVFAVFFSHSFLCKIKQIKMEDENFAQFD